jgi:hypothetical protein
VRRCILPPASAHCNSNKGVLFICEGALLPRDWFKKQRTPSCGMLTTRGRNDAERGGHVCSLEQGFSEVTRRKMLTERGLRNGFVHEVCKMV